MMLILTRRKILRTKIIMELGCNHQGDIAIAKQMIDDAKKLGAWSVKLQKRDIEAIPDNVKTKKRDMSNSFGETYYAHRKKLEFTVDEMIELKKYIESAGMVAMVSVFDIKSARDMVDADYRYIKTPSQLFTDTEICEYLLEARQDRIITLICSTGMHTLSELYKTPWFDRFDILLYCRSIYPHGAESSTFGAMAALHKNLEYSRLGYSSHDKNGDMIPYAIICSAEYVERHYTLDKKMKGSDHSTVSSDFVEMEKIIEGIKKAELIVGETGANVSELCDERERAVRMVYRGF